MVVFPPKPNPDQNTMYGFSEETQEPVYVQVQ